jgi:hypothetical protein
LEVESFIHDAFSVHLINIILTTHHWNVSACLELPSDLGIDIELALLQLPLTVTGLIEDAHQVALDREDLSQEFDTFGVFHLLLGS